MNTQAVQNINSKYIYQRDNINKQSFKGSERTVAGVADRVANTMMRPSLSKHLLEVKNSNNYNGEPIDLGKAYELIKKLSSDLKNAQKEKQMQYRGDVANWCFNYAYNFNNNPLSKDYSLSESTRNAIITEFLNRVCAKFGFNLSLHANDLSGF